MQFQTIWIFPTRNWKAWGFGVDETPHHKCDATTKCGRFDVWSQITNRNIIALIDLVIWKSEPSIERVRNCFFSNSFWLGVVLGLSWFLSEETRWWMQVSRGLGTENCKEQIFTFIFVFSACEDPQSADCARKNWNEHKNHEEHVECTKKKLKLRRIRVFMSKQSRGTANFLSSSFSFN